MRTRSVTRSWWKACVLVGAVTTSGAAAPTTVPGPGASTTKATTATSRPQRFPIGTKVEADEHGTGSFIAAVVKRVGRHHYYVSFDGWSDTFDKWLPFEQVRARVPGKVYTTPPARPRMRNERPRPIPPEPPAPAAVGAVEVDRGDPTPDAPATDAPPAVDTPPVAETPRPPVASDAPVLGASTDGAKSADTSKAQAPFEPDPRGEVKASRRFDLRRYEQNNAAGMVVSGMLRGPEVTDRLAITHRAFDRTPGARPGSTYTRVETVDLGTGRTVGSVNLPVGVEPLSLSADGTRMAARMPEAGERVGPGAESSLLGFYEVRAAVARPLAVFAPFKSGANVGFAVPVGGNRVAVAATMGSVAVLEVTPAAGTEAAKVRVIWESRADETSPKPVAFSANLRHVAVHRNGGLAVLRTEDGVCVARIEGVGVGYVSFAPGGGKLAVTEGAILSVYDLTAGGERTVRVATSLGTARGALPTVWLTDDLVVLDGEKVVDAGTGLAVWKLALPEGRPVMGAGATMLSVDTGMDEKGVRNTIVPTVLPVERMRAVAKSAPKDAFDYRPGEAVRLEVSHEDADAGKKVEAALRQKLAEAGVKVRDDAPSVLRASASAGPSRQQRMRNSRTMEDFEVTVPSRTFTIEWSVAGRAVYTRKGTFEADASFIRARAGADIAEMVRKSLSTGEQFLSTPLPPFDTSIPKPEWTEPKESTPVP